MNNNYITERIRSLKSCMRIPYKRINDKHFVRNSYFNAAVNLLLKMIDESKISPAAIIAEDFIKKMDEYSCESRNNSNIFSIAKDAGEWVLDNIIYLQSNKGE